MILLLVHVIHVYTAIDKNPYGTGIAYMTGNYSPENIQIQITINLISHA